MLRNRETSQTFGATFVQQFANAEDDLDHSRAAGGAGAAGSAAAASGGGGGGGGRVTASGAIELSVRSGEKDEKDSDREDSSRSHHGKSRAAEWTREVGRDMGRDWNKEREWGRPPASSSAGGDRAAGGAAGGTAGGAARDAGREKPRVVDDTLEDDDDSPADPEVLSRWKYGTPTSAWYATRFNKRRRNPWASGGHGSGAKSGRGGILSFSLSAVDLVLLLLLMLLLVYVHEQDHRGCDVFVDDLEFLRKQLFRCRAESFDLKKQLNNAYRGRAWSAWQHCGASPAQMSAYYNYTPGSTCPPVTVSVTSGASGGSRAFEGGMAQPPQQQLQGESQEQQQKQQQQQQQQRSEQSGQSDVAREQWDLPPSSRLDEALLFDARCLDLPRRACFSDSSPLSPSTAATTAADTVSGGDAGGVATGESAEPPSREAARWTNPEAKSIAWELYGPCRDWECLMEQEDQAERAWRGDGDAGSSGGGGGGGGVVGRGDAKGEGMVAGTEGAESEGLEIGRLGLPAAVRGCLVSCFNLSKARERGARGAYAGFDGDSKGSGLYTQAVPAAPEGAAIAAEAAAAAAAATAAAGAAAAAGAWGMDAVLAVKPPGGIRVGVDIGGGTGNFAALMADRGVTVVTTASNHGAPVMEVLAHRALPALHLPPTARLPLSDSSLDLIHCAFWPAMLAHPPALESVLYDWDRVLRPGGLVWLEMVPFSRPLIRKILAVAEVAQWKKLKWAKVAGGGGSGVGRSGEWGGDRGGWLLNVLFEKPMKRVQEEKRAIAVMS
ncbi:unnamed protein product [Closterium sp. Yama58-4]|nr:unnamed protein product [Closterium sp. Yama58-4]